MRNIVQVIMELSFSQRGKRAMANMHVFSGETNLLDTQ